MANAGIPADSYAELEKRVPQVARKGPHWDFGMRQGQASHTWFHELVSTSQVS